MRIVRHSPASQFFALVFLLAIVTCNGRGAAGGPSNVTTREQISALPDRTAYEIVERLRPGWFRSQTANSSDPIPPVVYGDDLRGSLTGIRWGYIERIEHLDSKGCAITRTTTSTTSYRRSCSDTGWT